MSETKELIERGALNKDNRLRCFTCGRWVRADLTVIRKFNGIPEPVCYTCREKFNIIDETEEMEKMVYEKMKEAMKEQTE